MNLIGRSGQLCARARQDPGSANSTARKPPCPISDDMRLMPYDLARADRPCGEQPMARTLVSSGSSFEADIGYSRAVIDGAWIFVSGTTGFDYATMTVSDDVVA